MTTSKKTLQEPISTLEEASKVGYLGTKVDPTPDEHYTVAGVLAEKPTPENDQQSRAAAREAADRTDG